MQLFLEHLKSMSNVDQQVHNKIKEKLQRNIRFQVTNVLKDKLPEISLQSFIDTIKATDEELMKEREMRLYKQFVQQCLMEYFHMCAKVVAFDAMKESTQLSNWLKNLCSHSKRQKSAILQGVETFIDNSFQWTQITAVTKRYQTEVNKEFVPQCSGERIKSLINKLSVTVTRLRLLAVTCRIQLCQCT